MLCRTFPKSRLRRICDHVQLELALCGRFDHRTSIRRVHSPDALLIKQPSTARTLGSWLRGLCYVHQSGQCSASETRSANSRYSNCYTFVSTRCQRIRDIGTRLILSRSRVWRDEIHWNVNTWRNIAAGVRHRAVQFGRLDASLIPTVLFSSLKHIRLCTTAM